MYTKAGKVHFVLRGQVFKVSKFEFGQALKRNRAEVSALLVPYCANRNASPRAVLRCVPN